MNTGASKGCRICKKLECMKAEEIWMRDHSLQCKEELEIYDEMVYRAALHFDWRIRKKKEKIPQALGL